jgi:transcriptional regulator with PAS, ATPase and Fis domain
MGIDIVVKILYHAIMKKKALSYYLDLMKSAQDKQEYNKVKRYGEIALKKLPDISNSPYEKYLLYCRLGSANFYLAEYSRSLEYYYKAYLVAIKHHLKKANIIYASLAMGYNFMCMQNINQALVQLQRVEQYYQEYGDCISPMDKRKYFDAIMSLGQCYLYKNNLVKAKEIIEKKFLPNLSLAPDKITNINYCHLKGEYLMATKNYQQASRSFNVGIKISEQFNDATTIHTRLRIKIHLATIELLEGHLELSIQQLELVMEDARRQKFNDISCETGLLLSKCYTLKNLFHKSASIEKQIKPIINKLDITWLYEKTKEFEQLYRKLQPIYQTETKSIPRILGHTINQHHANSSCKDIIIGQSIPMTEVYQLIEKVAITDLPILIQGETGTGKELIAKAVHNNSSRSEEPWLAINCGAIPESLLENTLFGHIKGAFTDAKEDKKGYIELASDGTLFLDEIGDMSPNMQQKLLRVLEEKLVWRVGAQKPFSVNTRFIFASNQDIEELVKQTSASSVQGKRFREDLYYRINTIVITLPPLRDRKEDIPLLITYFLKKYFPSRHSERSEESLPEISSSALALLIDYPWPGNIRELENEIKRICTLYPNVKQITKSMLSESIQNSFVPSFVSKSKPTLKEARQLGEKNVIREALLKCNGNITHAARRLGCTYRHLHRKMEQLNIPVKQCNYVTKL